MNIKTPFGIRLWMLIAVLALVAGGTIYGFSAVWQRVQQLESNLNGSQLDSFRFADEVQVGLLKLNESMLSYVLVRQPQTWKQFEQASSTLDDWIDEHDPVPDAQTNSMLTTRQERRVFKELNRAYEDYKNEAQVLFAL